MKIARIFRNAERVSTPARALAPISYSVAQNAIECAPSCGRLGSEMRVKERGKVLMKAMQVNEAGHEPAIIVAELQKPKPGSDEILIQVRAAGVTPTELIWYPTTHTKSGTARLRAIPGHEFSGVIAAIGKDVHGFKVGRRGLWHERLVRKWGHGGVLYNATREYSEEARKLKSRSCRLGADRRPDSLARTDRSSEAGCGRAHINPWRRGSRWPLRCANGA